MLSDETVETGDRLNNAGLIRGDQIFRVESGGERC